MQPGLVACWGILRVAFPEGTNPALDRFDSRVRKGPSNGEHSNRIRSAATDGLECFEFTPDKIQIVPT